MTHTLQHDVFMSERALRVEAHHVDGPEGGLAYVVAYTTDSNGQWMMVADWSFDALGGGDALEGCERALKKWLSLLLR